MNKRRKFGPLLTLRDLHLLLKSDANIYRFFGVPAPTKPFRHCVLEGQRESSLLSLEQEVRHTTSEKINSLPRTDRPSQGRTPLLTASFGWIRISSKLRPAPQSQARIGVGDNDADIVSRVRPIQVLAPLPMCVDVDHPLAVNCHRQSHIVGFRGSVHPEDCSMKEKCNA